MYYTTTYSKGVDGRKTYVTPGQWRSAEHVHLSTGCQHINHQDPDDAPCPYHQERQKLLREERARNR
jgi:hypothetical protein